MRLFPKILAVIRIRAVKDNLRIAVLSFRPRLSLSLDGVVARVPHGLLFSATLSVSPYFTALRCPMKNRISKFHGSKTGASLASLLCTLLAVTSASAQDWTGGGDGIFWTNSANWSSSPVSASTTNLSFSNASPLVTIHQLGNFSFNTLIQSAAGSLLISGNSNTANTLEMAGSNPVISISGGGRLLPRQ